VISNDRPIDRKDSDACYALVSIGFAFLTMGIVMGALWAKEAWGDYWTWDPKETWAAVTWMAYLLYLHAREHVKDQQYCYAPSDIRIHPPSDLLVGNKLPPLSARHEHSYILSLFAPT
jgi:hypothetical protein